MRFKRAAFVSLVGVSMFALGACSQSEGGTAETESPPASSASSAPTTSGSANELAGLDPCSVLNTAEVEKHGAVEDGAPERKTVGSASVCSWPGDAGGSAKRVPTFSVAIRENGGVGAMNDKGFGVDQTSEGGRDYGRAPDNVGCTIAIGVTDNSRVDILVSGIDPEPACEMANELVEVAEPRVPKG